MSRSNFNQTFNPCHIWFGINGNDGSVNVFDIDTGEKSNVNIPFTFLYLDQTSTIKGWDGENDCGIWSNEVQDLKKFPFVVRSTKTGVIAEGLYKEISDKIKAFGAHFVLNVYIATKTPAGEYEIGCLNLKGATLQEWFVFRRSNYRDICSKAVSIISFRDEKKGVISYKVPVFSIVESDDEGNKIALELDRKLQEHFDILFNKNIEEKVDVETPESLATPVQDNQELKPENFEHNEHNELPF